jgi:hypothetical protein
VKKPILTRHQDAVDNKKTKTLSSIFQRGDHAFSTPTVTFCSPGSRHVYPAEKKQIKPLDHVVCMPCPSFPFPRPLHSEWKRSEQLSTKPLVDSTV